MVLKMSQVSDNEVDPALQRVCLVAFPMFSTAVGLWERRLSVPSVKVRAPEPIIALMCDCRLAHGCSQVVCLSFRSVERPARRSDI